MRKYRNKFEKDIGEILGREWQYEQERVSYTIQKKYLVDFIKRTQEKDYLIEAKGYFRVGDTQKYKAIRDNLTKEQELIFVLYTPNKPVRKGSKTTMAKWCEKEGFRWYTLNNVEEIK